MPRVTTPRTLSRVEARRIAVRAQMLDAPRPDDLVEVVTRLTHLPLNVTDIVVPSAEHIAFSRLGPGFARGGVREAVEVDLTLFEHLDQPTPVDPVAIMIRPVADLPLLRAAMDAWPDTHPRTAAWLGVNGAFVEDVLDALRSDGPLPQSQIRDTAVVPYTSSGWNTSRNVAMLLEALQEQGVVVVVERLGAERVWDLAERVLPEVDAVPLPEARRALDERRLAALGIARPKLVGDAGVPVRVEGVRGERRIQQGASADGFEGRVAVLSPLDRLIADKPRMRELWDFEYALEQYTSAAKRRWGAFALPILHGADLVGKVDARTDRDAGVLAVNALHWDVAPDARLRDAVADELAALAGFIGVGLRLP